MRPSYLYNAGNANIGLYIETGPQLVKSQTKDTSYFSLMGHLLLGIRELGGSIIWSLNILIFTGHLSI